MARIKADIDTVSPRNVQTGPVDIPETGFAGEALEQIGSFVAKQAGKMKQEREELANGAFNTYATTTFQQELQAATLEEQQQGGANYASRITARAAEIRARIIGREGYTGEQPTQEFLPRVDQQLASMASSAVTKGLVFEHNYNVNQALEGVGEARRASEVSVFDNPGSFEETLEAQERALAEGYSFLGQDAVKEEATKLGTELADASIRGYLEQDPGALLADLEGGRFDPYLDAERKSQFVNAAQAKMDAALAKAERTFEANTTDHLSSLAETGQGIEGLSDEADIAYANNPAKLAAFRRSEKLALVGFTTKKTLENSGPVAAQNYLNSIAHPPGTIGFAARQRVLSGLKGAVGAEAVSDIKTLTTDSVARIEALGVEGPEAAELHALEQTFLTGEELAEAKRKREAAYQFNREYNFLLQSDPAEAANYLTSVKPGVNTEDFARVAQEANRRNKVWSQIQEQRAQDPSAYVLRNDDDLETRISIAEQNYATARDPLDQQAAAKTLQRYDNELLLAQADLGVTQPKLLSNQAKELIALQYQKAPDPQAKSDLIDSLSARYGYNWQRVTRELGDSLPPEASLAVTMTHPNQRQARVRLLEIADVGVGTIKKAIGDKNVSTTNNLVREQLTDFGTTVSGVGATGVIQRYQAATSALAYEYIRRGDAPADAVEKAVNEMVNGQYEYDGRTRIPNLLDTDRVSSVLSQTKDNLDKLYKISPPPSLFSPDADTTEDYIDSIKDNGFWSTSADDTGVYLRDQHGANVFDIDGNPIFLSFEQTKTMDPTRFYSLTDFDATIDASPEHMQRLSRSRAIEQVISEYNQQGKPQPRIQRRGGQAVLVDQETGELIPLPGVNLPAADQ